MQPLRVIGYGICGGGEAKRYMRATLNEFKRLCDETIILGNNITDAERNLIKEYGFRLVEDDREWGRNQWRIKEDFVRDHVSKLSPDWLICLDMDEVFHRSFTRDSFGELGKLGGGFRVFIVNLWNDGYKAKRCFWNVRIWRWNGDVGFERKPLHCGLAPRWTYFTNLHAPYILKHYGLMLAKDRQAKINRYKQYDPNQIQTSSEYYRSLGENDCDEFNEDELQAKVEAEVKTYKQTRKEIKKVMTQEFIYIRRTKDGMLLDIPKAMLGNYQQRINAGEFEIVGDIQEPVKAEASVAIEHQCHICGKVSKNATGLRVHGKIHK
jgi:hypothetical protein